MIEEEVKRKVQEKLNEIENQKIQTYGPDDD
jgi:hypothetical protein